MCDFTADLVWRNIQFAATALADAIGYFIGGVDGLITTLLILVGLDCITGIICAIVEKTFSSFVLMKGTFRKVLIFMLVGVAHIIGLNLFGTPAVLRSPVLCFYLATEGGSVIKNASRLGLPIPEKLKTALLLLHEKTVLPQDGGKSEQGDGE